MGSEKKHTKKKKKEMVNKRVSRCSYSEGGPGVEGDLLVHDKLQNICFLLIKQFTAGGFNLFVEMTAPFTAI